VAIYGHPRHRSSPTSASTRCNIAARNRRVSRPPTASSFGCNSRWAWSPIFFTADALGPCSRLAGHRSHRYSTTGIGAAQRAAHHGGVNKGKIALAHNGNITNALEVADNWTSRVPFFQTTATRSHRSPDRALARRDAGPTPWADSLRRTGGRVFAGHGHTAGFFRRARSPGFPAAGNGRISGQEAHRADTVVFALRDLRFRSDRARPMNARSSRATGHRCPEGVHSRFYSPQQPQSSWQFSSMFISRGLDQAGLRACGAAVA